MTWRRSSVCSAGGCVEIAELPSGGVAVRDSRDHEHVLRFTLAEWDAFLKGVKAGEFDRT